LLVYKPKQKKKEAMTGIIATTKVVGSIHVYPTRKNQKKKVR
jgi:hypothetical protein